MKTKLKFVPTLHKKHFMNIYLELMVCENKVHYRYTGDRFSTCTHLLKDDAGNYYFIIKDRAKDILCYLSQFKKH